MPRFILQRSLYEVRYRSEITSSRACKADGAEQVRERPSKVYSWPAFILANILVEIPYQVLLSILVYVCYYYPVFGFVFLLNRVCITSAADRLQYSVFRASGSDHALLYSDLYLC
jgi:ABC-type multidrug transport system permease subunit